MKQAIFSVLLLCCLAPLASARNQGIIQGRISGEADRPLQGVNIVLTRTGLNATRTVSGADGRYRFRFPDTGSFTITFSAPGYESLRITGIPAQGEKVLLDAHLNKAGVWGNSIVTKCYLPRLNIAGGRMIAPGGRFAKHRGVTGGLDVAEGSFAPEAASPASFASRSSAVAAPEARSGTLTSGEINDFAKWKLWEDLSMEELKQYRGAWPFRPEARYTVALRSRNGRPLANARVSLRRGGSTIWTAVTDNTGKAELWYGMWDTGAQAPSPLAAVVEYGRQEYHIPALKPFSEGVNFLTTNFDCFNPARLDIAFLVDATGSMGDEIAYLKAELGDILKKVQDSMPDLQVQTGALFYRDAGDDYLTRSSALSADFSKTEAFIADNSAAGGGDFPEAVDAALAEGLTAFHWRSEATARLAFLVLDAPPHEDAATQKRMRELTERYAAAGIRIIPVVCSGSDKANEYLMRAMALAANGTYVFLTDHSGIGGSHLAPTTDGYDVSFLNNLIYRIIHQFAYMPPCGEQPAPIADTANTHSDSAALSFRFYPNPTTGAVYVEHRQRSGYVQVSDISGKIILSVSADASGHTLIELGQFPVGVYTIAFCTEKGIEGRGKLMLVH